MLCERMATLDEATPRGDVVYRVYMVHPEDGMATLTARLDDWLREEIVRFWQTHGEGPSSALRHVAQEWWAMQEFPAITFRDGVSGRRAVLRGGPDVWEVARVARAYGEDRQGFYEHFSPYVERGALDQALAYTERFSGEIEALIAENERLEARLRRAGAR